MQVAIIRKFAFTALAALALAPVSQAQSTLAGDWKGLLTVGGTQFHILWHAAAAKDGSLTSTLDNVDQGIFAIPVKSVTLKDSHMTLTVDDAIQINGQAIQVSGVYDATVNAAATETKGMWTQTAPQLVPATELDFERIPAAKPAPPSDIDGVWTGILDAGTVKLHVGLKIVNTADGLTAALQSPDQSPAWLPATSIARSGDVLTVEFKPIAATYTAKIGADLASLDGTFTQMSNPLPLKLIRVAADAKPPATPAAAK
jgi:hypothetical protein